MSEPVDNPPELARELDLAPHPEGGWFRQTWRSPVEVTFTDVDGVEKTRPTATLILFLLTAGESSAWHRVTSDETWIATSDHTVTLEVGGTGERPGEVTRHVLGLSGGDSPHILVPAGTWQRTLPADHDALASCLVSPGFDFADFRLL